MAEKGLIREYSIMINQIKQKYCRRRDILKLILKYFWMWMVDLIRGISGGTIAFILGIYADLISSIKSFDWQFI